MFADRLIDLVGTFTDRNKLGQYHDSGMNN